MGVYIKGIGLPISCERCPMLDWDLDYIKCKITNRHFKMTECWRSIRVPDCPLVPVPEHGDLIDRDTYEKLLRGLGSRDYRREKGTISDAIKFLHPHYTPAIIPAEEGET